MKKFSKEISLFLALALVLALANGCGNKGTNQTSTDVSTEASAESSVAESTEESSVEESSEEESSEKESSVEESSVEESSEEPSEETETGDVVIMGEGSTTFYFKVITADQETTSFQINTDETTVGAALLAVGLIEGEESEYGLYVKTVNGVTADYNVDGTYWAFYINDEYAMTGVDSTDVNEGDTYTFAVEK